MGLYAGRTDPRRLDLAAIGVEMRPALEQWFSAHLQFVDPKTLEATPYDAKTDTGGDSVPKLVFDTGPGGALLQPTRQFDVRDFGDQSFGITTVRIQVIVPPPDVQFRSGLIAIVVDGGNDSQLTGERIALDSALSSSLAWDKIIRGRVVAQ